MLGWRRAASAMDGRRLDFGDTMAPHKVSTTTLMCGTGGISDFSYEHSETKRVYVRAEQSDNSSSISSQATRFSTALAEVYQAHSQEVTALKIEIQTLSAVSKHQKVVIEELKSNITRMKRSIASAKVKLQKQACVQRRIKLELDRMNVSLPFDIPVADEDLDIFQDWNCENPTTSVHNSTPSTGLTYSQQPENNTKPTVANEFEELVRSGSTSILIHSCKECSNEESFSEACLKTPGRSCLEGDENDRGLLRVESTPSAETPLEPCSSDHTVMGKALDATACLLCEKWYSGVVRVDKGVCFHKNRCWHKPQDTDPRMWNISFPNSDECNDLLEN